MLETTRKMSFTVSKRVKSHRIYIFLTNLHKNGVFIAFKNLSVVKHGKKCVLGNLVKANGFRRGSFFRHTITTFTTNFNIIKDLILSTD